MTVEDEFHKEMLAIYGRVGSEIGYWAKRYRPAVERHGGLAYAKRG